MRSLARILSTAQSLWPYYLGVAVSSVLIATTNLLTPFIVKHATDTVVNAQTSENPGAVRTVTILALALLAVELSNTVIQNVGGYLGDVMAIRLRQILSTRYFAKLLGLPQRYFDDQVTGTIISRLTRSITEITTFLNSFTNNFLPMLLTLGAVLVVSAIYYWPLAILLTIIFPTYMVLTTLTSKRWQVWEGQKNEHIDVAGGRFAEVMSQIRVVKSFAQERLELKHFAHRYHQTVGITKTQSRYWHRMDTIRRSFLNLVFFGVYLILFLRTVNGDFTIGDMVLLIQLVAMARMPVQMMSYLVDTSQRAIAGSKDFFAVMSEQPGDGEPQFTDQQALGAQLGDEHTAGDRSEHKTQDMTAQLARTNTPAMNATAADAVETLADSSHQPAAVEFDHITFSYDGPAVLHDVTFSIPPGHKVALVSESGGGKTTLVSLLLGFYRVSLGQVRIAGHDINTLSLAQLRRQVGVVFQDASLFSGTIRENISYGKAAATDAEIHEAARRAHADTFITQFPQGYESTIGERGLKLSGGQKQRIAVARAMLKDAPILILDEATSALDTKSERAVQQGLDELMRNRTTLIIAHRLSTISAVDTIVTLHNGAVDEIGSPDELATTGGIYSQLLQLQASASKKDRKRLRNYGILG